MPENINILTELINSIGFPIVMVAYFIWDKTKVTNKLVSTIENNNLILSKLLVKLDSGDLEVTHNEEK